MSLHDRLLTEVDRREAIVAVASPGPWVYNGYAAVASSPLARQYDVWLEPLVDANHSVERHGDCPACGPWRGDKWAASPGLGHGCRHFDEDYEQHDPWVATVPAYSGDLAHGRHQADAQFIEMHDPIDATRRYAHYRRILTRHRTFEADTGRYWCDYCEDHFMVPHCPEVADLAEALGIPPLEEKPGEAVDDTRTIG